MTTIDRTSERITFLVLTSAVTTYALLQSLVIPVLPTLEGTLHTSQTGVTWVLTAYLLSASVCTPILGRAGDIAGKKRMFVCALGALAAGSFIAAAAGSLAIMIVARLIQGAGGGVLPLAFGIIRDEFSADRVAGAIGKLSAITAAGAGLGMVLTGPIVDVLGVRALFWLPGILVTLAAVTAHFVVPESLRRTPGRISLWPAFLLSAWLVCMLVAVSEAAQWGWASARVLALFGAGSVLIVFWVISEQRAVAPLIDMRMMRLPVVWRTNLVTLLIGIGMYASFAFLPQFLQTPRSAGYGFAATITRAGLILLPGPMMTFVIGQSSGRLIRAFGAKRLIVVGSAIGTVSMILFAVAHDYLWQVELDIVVNGIGYGMAFAAMSIVVVQAVPHEQTGVASGMNANIRTIGGSFGAALMATVVTAGALAGHPPPESGYTAGWAMLAMTTGLAALAAVFIPAAPKWAGRDLMTQDRKVVIVAGNPGLAE